MFFKSIMMVVFELLPIFLVANALLVVVVKNPVHSVLLLILVFFDSAVFLLYLGLDYFAFLLLVVYAGAVAVLFLFVVMMLNLRVVGRFQSMVVGHLVGVGAMVAIAYLIYELIITKRVKFLVFSYLTDSTSVEGWDKWFALVSSLKLIGSVLYTWYAFPFIIASSILFVALVVAVVLTFVVDKSVWHQSSYFQIVRSNKVISL